MNLYGKTGTGRLYNGADQHMLDKEELKRYNRQIILPEIGISGQEKLKAAKVLVIGAGGLGCPVLQFLAAAGVGAIGIVDNDTVDESNLQRQILFSYSDTGKNKARTAAEKLRSANSFIRITAFPERLEPGNASEILAGFDLVIDGSDNFETRYLVNDECVRLNKPLVFGSIFGFEGQISVFNYLGGPTYRCVFPEPGEAPNCSVNGVLGVLPGIVGTYMANEALKIILGIGEVLSGKLMVLNTLENSTHLFKINRVSGSDLNHQKQSQTLSPPEDEISWKRVEELLKDDPKSYYLVDVREPLEAESDDTGGINIPLSELPDEIGNLPTNKQIIFYCNSGRRSKAACDIARQQLPFASLYWTSPGSGDT